MPPWQQPPQQPPRSKGPARRVGGSQKAEFPGANGSVLARAWRTWPHRELGKGKGRAQVELSTSRAAEHGRGRMRDDMAGAV